MSGSSRTDRPLAAIAAGAVVLSLLSGGLTVAVSAGFTRLWGDSGTDAAGTSRTLVSAASPARDAIQGALDSVDPSDGQAQTTWSALPPFPFHCAVVTYPAALSASKQITVDGTDVQVVATAYGAGLASLAVPELNDALGSCTGALDNVHREPATFISGSLSAEAYQVVVDRQGLGRTTVMGRTGDVIWFAASASTAVTAQAAEQLSAAVDTQLADVCADTGSDTSDATRNLILADKYVPYHRPVMVKIDHPGLPSASSSNATPVDLNRDVPALPDVTPASTPAWPVWPRMPEPVEKPVITKPAAAPVTTGEYRQRIFDEIGPGCGWAFTGAAATDVDQDDIARTNKDAQAAGVDRLEADAEDWKAQVLRFWKQWPVYRAQVAAYERYRAEVNAVNTAWQVINRKWANYAQLTDAYEEDLDDYAVRLAQIDRAGRDYQAALTACEEALMNPPTPDPTETPTPDPTDTPTPDPTDTPTPSPTSDDSVDAQAAQSAPSAEQECRSTVALPRILAEPAPVAPVRPTPPADPRPLAERD